MVPDSLATLYALLALIAPGLAFQLVSERTRPPREESAFREASVVAVTSLVFTTLSVMILAAASREWPIWFVDVADWLDEGNQYASDNLWLVAKSVGLEVAVAVSFACLGALALSVLPTASKSPVAKTSVWWQALQGDKPKDKASWVKAELVDGTQIWGYVHYFTIQDIGNDRDISFTGPGLSIQRGIGKPVEENYYKYYVVGAAQIRLLKVGHEPTKQTVSAKRERRRLRKASRPPE
jgi:hypothetical protein